MTGFEEVTGALQYTTQQDGTVQLAQLPFLEVLLVHFCTSTFMLTFTFTSVLTLRLRPLFLVYICVHPYACTFVHTMQVQSMHQELVVLLHSLWSD